VTTPAGPVGGNCRVTYEKNDWGGGFTAAITITNTGTTAVNGWTLGFSFPGNQRVTQPGWGATFTQASGSANVSATNASYNGTIAPNGSVGIGFNGTFSGANTAVSGFTLNNTACSTS
jgi:Cellulose binding domain